MYSYHIMKIAIKSAAVALLAALVTYLTVILLNVESPYPATVVVAVVVFVLSVMVQKKKVPAEGTA